jgi:small subunit ribosomal protein S13|tara:strand:- start:137 stop:619 length:483 start_codon:yes stop_codon:yes gene_type:complete
MSEQNLETQRKKESERIVRVMSKDIEGGMKIYPGLTKIKGISWTISNAICKKLKLDKDRLIGSLTEEEVKKIVEFMKNPDLPNYLKNRKADFETGEDKHLTGADLDLEKEFDVKRLKKIRTYRGLRHSIGLPMRGQRTKSNFRKHRKKGGGIKKKGPKKQ